MFWIWLACSTPTPPAQPPVLPPLVDPPAKAPGVRLSAPYDALHLPADGAYLTPSDAGLLLLAFHDTDEVAHREAFAKALEAAGFPCGPAKVDAGVATQLCSGAGGDWSLSTTTLDGQVQVVVQAISVF